MRNTLLALALCLSCSACPKGGPTTPQAAAVAWLAAVDEGDFVAAARLSPPGLSEAARAELAADLATRLKGVRRVDSTPLRIATPADGREVEAQVTVAVPGKGEKTLSLTLVEVEGRWAVVPPRFGEVVAW